MNGSYAYDSRVTVQTETETDSAGGVIKQWVNGDVLWANVVQKVLNMYITVKLDFDQRFAQTSIYRVTTRGKQNWNFESTRFLWNSPSEGIRTLEPFESQRLLGKRNTYFTSILTRDITDLKEGPA